MKISPRKARELRARAMLSQEELAEEVGVSPFTVWRWEHGEAPVGVRPKTARKLAEALGADPTELLPSVEPLRRETPPVLLAEMFRADPDARRKALADATAEEIERYLADIAKQLESAQRIKDEEDTPEGRAGAVRYAARLGMLHNEAGMYAAHLGMENQELVGA